VAKYAFHTLIGHTVIFSLRHLALERGGIGLWSARRDHAIGLRHRDPTLVVYVLLFGQSTIHRNSAGMTQWAALDVLVLRRSGSCSFARGPMVQPHPAEARPWRLCCSGSQFCRSPIDLESLDGIPGCLNFLLDRAGSRSKVQCPSALQAGRAALRSKTGARVMGWKKSQSPAVQRDRSLPRVFAKPVQTRFAIPYWASPKMGCPREAGLDSH